MPREDCCSFLKDFANHILQRERYTRLADQPTSDIHKKKAHIVLDIDHTIAIRSRRRTNFIKNYSINFPQNCLRGTYEHTDYNLALLPGAVELINWLLNHQDIKLHFYSTASENFNIKTLNEILQRTGLSENDRKNLFNDQSFIFSKKHCRAENLKDLTHISERINSSILLIDNTPNVTLDEQNNNLFTHTFYTRDKLQIKENDQSCNNISLTQMFFIAGVIDTLIKKNPKLIAVNIHDTLPKKAMLDESDYNFFCLLGLKVLRQFNSELTLPKKIPENMQQFAARQIEQEEEKYYPPTPPPTLRRRYSRP